MNCELIVCFVSLCWRKRRRDLTHSQWKYAWTSLRKMPIITLRCHMCCEENGQENQWKTFSHRQRRRRQSDYITLRKKSSCVLGSNSRQLFLSDLSAWALCWAQPCGPAVLQYSSNCIYHSYPWL